MDGTLLTRTTRSNSSSLSTALPARRRSSISELSQLTTVDDRSTLVHMFMLDALERFVVLCGTSRQLGGTFLEDDPFR